MENYIMSLKGDEFVGLLFAVCVFVPMFIGIGVMYIKQKINLKKKAK